MNAMTTTDGGGATEKAKAPSTAVASHPPVSYIDADSDKKLSLLKKAVLSLTKQKQELETLNEALTGKLAMLGDTITKAHETENALREELSEAHAELLQLRTATSTRVGAAITATAAAGVASIKGLLSGTQANVNATAVVGKPSSTPQAAKSPSLTPTQPHGASLALSEHDHEQLLQENESLHIQLFDLKTQCDLARKEEAAKRKEVEDQVTKEVEKQKAMMEQHKALQAQIDILQSNLAAFEAQDLFCRTFLLLETNTSSLSSPVSSTVTNSVIVRPTPSILKAEVSPALYHATARGIEHLCENMETLSASTIALHMVARDLWQQRRSAMTTGGSPSSNKAAAAYDGAMPEVQQLQTYLKQHMSKRDVLMSKLSSLRDLVVREAQDNTFFSHLQLEVLQWLEEWLGSLLGGLELLVEGTIPLVSRSVCFAVPSHLCGGASSSTTTNGKGSVSVPRDEAIEMLVQMLRRHVQVRKGAVKTLQSLLTKRMKFMAMPPEAPSWVSLWLDALVAGHHAASQCCLPVRLGDLTNWWQTMVVDERACRMLQTISVSLQASLWYPFYIQSSAAPLSMTLQGRSSGNDITSPHQVTTAKSASATTSADYLVPLLKQSDRAALTYFTQLQHALLEIAEKAGQMERLHARLQDSQKQIIERDDALKATKEAYEEQLRVLSDQLTANVAAT